MDAQTLVKQYPFLDEMMAETIISAYEGGYLDAVLAKSSTEPTRQPESLVLQGAVTVEE